MSWIPLDYLMRKIAERRFSWLVNSQTKYLQVRIDTRTDDAVLLDRDGKLLASTKEELDDLFGKLNHKADSNKFSSRERQKSFYGRLAAPSDEAIRKLPSDVLPWSPEEIQRAQGKQTQDAGAAGYGADEPSRDSSSGPAASIAAQDDHAFSSINETYVCPPACPVCGPKRDAQDDYRPHHCKHGTRGVYCFDFHPSHEREKCDAARTVAHAELKVPTQNDNGYGHTGPCPPNCTCDMAKAIARTQDADAGKHWCTGESCPTCKTQNVDTTAAKLHSTMDAKVWTDEFMRLFSGHVCGPGEVIDDGLMLGWFANAIMCGFDIANQRHAQQGDSK